MKHRLLLCILPLVSVLCIPDLSTASPLPEAPSIELRDPSPLDGILHAAEIEAVQIHQFDAVEPVMENAVDPILQAAGCILCGDALVSTCRLCNPDHAAMCRPRSADEKANDRRAIESMHPGERFALMFGIPLDPANVTG